MVASSLPRNIARGVRAPAPPGSSRVATLAARTDLGGAAHRVPGAYPCTCRACLAELVHQVGRVAVLALLATPLLWGVRMLARNQVSHSHLHVEAGKRVTMSETYLALLRDDAMKQDDRAIMLHALFRPMRTGLVKEDLPPAGLWDALTPKLPTPQ